MKKLLCLLLALTMVIPMSMAVSYAAADSQYSYTLTFTDEYGKEVTTARAGDTLNGKITIYRDDLEEGDTYRVVGTQMTFLYPKDGSIIMSDAVSEYPDIYPVLVYPGELTFAYLDTKAGDSRVQWGFEVKNPYVLGEFKMKIASSSLKSLTFKPRSNCHFDYSNYDYSDGGTGRSSYQAAGENFVLTILPPCSHTNASLKPAAASTCASTGNIAYWFCPDCGKYFKDNSNAIGDVINTTKTAIDLVNGHKYDKTGTCTICGIRNTNGTLGFELRQINRNAVDSNTGKTDTQVIDESELTTYSAINAGNLDSGYIVKKGDVISADVYIKANDASPTAISLECLHSIVTAAGLTTAGDDVVDKLTYNDSSRELGVSKGASVELIDPDTKTYLAHFNFKIPEDAAESTEYYIGFEENAYYNFNQHIGSIALDTYGFYVKVQSDKVINFTDELEPANNETYVVEYENKAAAPALDITPAGYDFQGWLLTNPSDRTGPGTYIQPAEDTVKASADLTYTAQYSRHKYTYNFCNGKEETVTNGSVEYEGALGQDIADKAAELASRPGFRIVGWAETTGAAIEDCVNFPVKMVKDTNLYPVYDTTCKLSLEGYWYAPTAYQMLRIPVKSTNAGVYCYETTEVSDTAGPMYLTYSPDYYDGAKGEIAAYVFLIPKNIEKKDVVNNIIFTTDEASEKAVVTLAYDGNVDQLKIASNKACDYSDVNYIYQMIVHTGNVYGTDFSDVYNINTMTGTQLSMRGRLEADLFTSTKNAALRGSLQDVMQAYRLAVQ